MNQRHLEENIPLYALTLRLGFLFLTLAQPVFPLRGFGIPLRVGGETASPGKYGSHMASRMETRKSSPSASWQVGLDGS